MTKFHEIFMKITQKLYYKKEWRKTFDISHFVIVIWQEN